MHLHTSDASHPFHSLQDRQGLRLQPPHAGELLGRRADPDHRHPEGRRRRGDLFWGHVRAGTESAAPDHRRRTGEVTAVPSGGYDPCCQGRAHLQFWADELSDHVPYASSCALRAAPQPRCPTPRRTTPRTGPVPPGPADRWEPRVRNTSRCTRV
jgi:hypothetical protein